MKILRHEERLGEPRCSEIRMELDMLVPAGLWRATVRNPLADHGFLLTGHESLAETVARALDIARTNCELVSLRGKSAPPCWKGLAGSMP
jgi:hypothetical protein